MSVNTFNDVPSAEESNDDQPLDLSNCRKRQLMFGDVNNNVVKDFPHGTVGVVSEDVTSQHGIIKKKSASVDMMETDKRVMLPPHATKVLLQWYNAHVSKPYATNSELTLLAQDARIEQSQARKWLSNKRARSGNTLAKNGQMHPRKMAKLEEIMQVEPFKRLNETSRDILEGLAGHAEESSHTIDERKQDLTMCASAEVKDNNKLTSSQRQQLETWFIEHIHEPNGPYPDAAMKRELAEKLGLDHSKIVNWFCNRRSRIEPKFKSKPTATVSAVSQRSSHRSEGSVVFSSIHPGMSNVGVNPWMPPLGAVPVINPYTGQSIPCASFGGMFFAQPAAMIPLFPWPVSGVTLPPPTGVAGGLSSDDVDVASRQIKPSTTSDVASKVSSPPVEVPQFALPSFMDYLAYQRSILEGAGSIPSPTVNKETK